MGTRLFVPSRFSLATKALALGMALAALVSIRPAIAAPADVFDIGAPTIGSDPPKANDVADGDASVATQTGAFEYSYKISTPPGRNGVQPHLSLNYSSQAAIYGTVASGWSMPIPAILEDTSQGRLDETPVFDVPPKRFMSTLAGSRPLVAVIEAFPPKGDVAQTYRAQNDTSFARYEQIKSGAGFLWRVLQTDGSTMYFGDTALIGACSTISYSNAPLTRMMDAFGNVVEYVYEPGVDGECRISNINWGANGTTLDHFAKANFGYVAAPICAGVPVGSQTSYRTGTKLVTGASQLQSITVTATVPRAASPDHTRVITLAYAAESSTCTGAHAAFRALSSITESAWGIDSPRVDLPSVTFSYAPAASPWSNDTSSSLPWFPIEDSSNGAYNLGWGYRFLTGGKWPTVEAMMLDVDGDGLLDRLTNHPVRDELGHIVACQAGWQRNLGPPHSHFADEVLFPLPTLKWASDPLSPNPFEGGAYAGLAGDGLAIGEGCSLNYQQTGYANSHRGGPACPGQTDPSCPASGRCFNGNDCSSQSNNPTATNLAFRWVDLDGDGLVDLVASPAIAHLNVYNLQQGGNPGAPPEPSIFGPWPGCPTIATTVGSVAGDYTMCSGMFPWFFYRNHGNGVFGHVSAVSNPLPGHPTTQVLPDQIQYRPAPLETSVGDSSLTAGAVGALAGSVDFDGDGYTDSIIAEPLSPPGTWNIYRTNSGGVYDPSRLRLFQVPTRSQASLNQSVPVVFGLSEPVSVQGLFDLNGDGLLDQWSKPMGATATNVAFNDGMGFRLPSGPGGGGEANIAQKPGNDGTTFAYPQPGGPFGFVENGYRYDTNRIIDMDGDGRADIVVAPSEGTPQVSFNQGGDFTPAPLLSGGVTFGEALRHYIIVTNLIGNSTTNYGWELRSDMLDLDGDGNPEAVSFGSGRGRSSQMHVARPATPVIAPRRLVAIDNGRGATTTIVYSSLEDTNTVTQTPNGNNVDGRPQASPNTNWVVQSLSTHDVFANTNAITTYRYYNPQRTADERGRVAFRGFQRVEMLMPANGLGRAGRSVTRVYSYHPDWSGRLTAEYVHPGEALGDIRSAMLTTWEARILFGASITTYHATIVENLTCADGQTEASCLPGSAGAAGYTRTVNEVTAFPVGAPTLQVQTRKLRSTVNPAVGLAEGDRETITTYVNAIDATNYRVHPAQGDSNVFASGAFVPYAKSRSVWDFSFIVPLTNEVWTSIADNTRLVTRREYDMSTGNVIHRWKPNQNAAGGPPLTYSYDSRQLFVAHELNEAGLSFDYTYEYGTGAKLMTLGPNVPSCTSGCPTGDTHPTREALRTRVDGLGRPIEQWKTFSDTGATYTLYQVETDTYTDAITSTGSTRVLRQRRRDINAATPWVQDETQFDGQGRPIKRTVFVQGSAPADEITSYHYSNDGTVSSIVLPDPTANDAANVAYTYGYDSLGRATSARRPDSTTAMNQSGVDIVYNGLTTTTSEFVGAAGGQVAVTTTVKDSFGRLAEVDEETGALTFASTHYAYGPDDNVSQVIDPEGVTTALIHDFAGRRTKIVRSPGPNQNAWQYVYDANGNLISELVPGSTSVTALNFTTSMAYDDLDRLVSKMIGPRNEPLSDQVLFGDTTEAYIWDVGANHRGYLRTWRSFGPGAGTATVRLDGFNNLQGQRVGIQETLHIAGYPELQRTFKQNYHLDGSPRITLYGDSFDGTNETGSELFYDNRGLLDHAELTLTTQPVLPIQRIADQTRNVAGLVTRRLTNIGSGPMNFVGSQWTYDKLGRVTSQVVGKGPGPIQVARQDLTYFGNDDVKSMDHWLGTTNHKRFQYTYDLRHQLAGVSEPLQGSFSAVYGYGSAGRFQQTTETALTLPNGNVKPRNVVYQYNGTDPEEVTALVNASGGQRFASYTYDAAGNQTGRCYGPATTPTCSGESTEYLYDGKDQLRRVVKRIAGVVQAGEEYWYDALGGRVAVVKRNAAGLKTELIWFIGDTEAHYDGVGAVEHVYSHLSMGTPVARIDRTAATITTVEYQFHGMASSTLAAVDQGGAINASFAYAPFGEIIEATGVSGGRPGVGAHRRRMNDKFVDEVSDLAYYGARFYDRTSMTWTQGDPLYRLLPELAMMSTPRRGNLSSFSLNSPLRYVDPDGRDAVWNPTGSDPHCNGATSFCDKPEESESGTQGCVGANCGELSIKDWVEFAEHGPLQATESWGLPPPFGYLLSSDDPGGPPIKLMLGFLLGSVGEAGEVALAAGSAGVDSAAGGVLTFFHGTSLESAFSLLGGAELDIEKVMQLTLGERSPGFYLATHFEDAEYFAARTGEGAILKYEMSSDAASKLGLDVTPIGPLGRWGNFVGGEARVAPEAFDLFNEFREQGLITVKGAW